MAPRKISLFVLLAALVLQATAADSTRVITLDAFFRQVAAFHPMVSQARLLNEQARQEIRLARGSFDPKLEADFASKEFQDKTYYNTFSTQVALPNRSPVTPKFGFQRTTGQLLNPSDKIPGGEQVFAGVEVQLGRGLFTDEQRTILKQAELLQTMLEAERIKIINKVILEAASAYWNWYFRQQAFDLQDRGLKVADEILSRVRLNHRHGEASVLDTVQASITRQTRWLERTEAEVELRNARLILSVFLWDANGLPVDLMPDVRPVWFEPSIATDVRSLYDQARSNHPELIKLRAKIDQLGLERQLAAEFLKPRLDLNYAMLSQPGTSDAWNARNDYKLGIDFSMPLLLRKERSKLRMAELKITSANLEVSRQEREILNSLEQIFNQLQTTRDLLLRQTEMVAAYEKLMSGELLNLSNGESDLFKINIQQEKLLQSQAKQVKLQAELQKNMAYLWWAAGRSPEL